MDFKILVVTAGQMRMDGIVLCGIEFYHSEKSSGKIGIAAAKPVFSIGSLINFITGKHHIYSATPLFFL